MIEIPVLLAWSALALAVTLTPGPDTMLVAGHAAKSGARAGLAAVAGIVVGGVWYMALCGFGYLSVVSASPPLYMTVKIVGAAYLLFIGVQMIWGALVPRSAKCDSVGRSASPLPLGEGLGVRVPISPFTNKSDRGTLSPDPSPTGGGEKRRDARPRNALRERLGAPFRQGLLTNALNPKVAVFYLAALPQFVGDGANAAIAGVLLIAIHYLMGAVWLSIVALGAARAGAGLKRSGLTRWLEGAIGVFFVGVAGRLALERN